MENVKHIEIKKNMKIDELIKEMENSGTLGAGDVVKAVKITKEMINDKDCNVILAVSGALIPSGMRKIITDMVKNKHIDALIVNGASIVHDTIEALGGHHIKGNYNENDIKLNKKGIGRAGNVFVPMKGFELFEKHIQKLLEEIIKERKIISIRELTYRLGNSLKDENSFLYQAAKNNIPVFSPAFQDSMLGLQLAFFKQENDLVVDSLGDYTDIDALVFEKNKTGAIILGGGVTKHFTLGINVLKDGLDYAINITTGTPHDGSLSGAKLEEGQSWGKAQSNAKIATVYGDVTIIFPLIWASVINGV